MVKATEWKSFDEWLVACLDAHFVPGVRDPRLIEQQESATLTEEEVEAMEAFADSLEKEIGQ